MEWTDATSYAQGERGNVEPTAWEWASGLVRIVVTSGHIYHRGTWIVRCPAFGIDTMVLGKASEMTASQAQAAALVKIAEKANAMKTAIDRLMVAASQAAAIAKATGAA